MTDRTIERPRLVAVPDGPQVPGARARESESKASIRASLNEMLAMPVMRARRGRGITTEAKRDDRVTIGLSLDASSLIEHLLEYRGGAGLRATATGYDVFAAMLLSEASSGMSRVQAMRLVVDMIEPIKRTLDVGAGGVTFVFGDATARESQQQEAV